MASPQLEEVARELGWGEVAEPDAAILDALLDDEVERLEPEAVERLRERAGGGLLVCGACRAVVLARYVPDEGRCRACAGALAVGPIVDGVAATRASGAAARVDLGDGAEAPAWELADELTLGRAVVLDPDN